MEVLIAIYSQPQQPKWSTCWGCRMWPPTSTRSCPTSIAHQGPPRPSMAWALTPAWTPWQRSEKWQDVVKTEYTGDIWVPKPDLITVDIAGWMEGCWGSLSMVKTYGTNMNDQWKHMVRTNTMFSWMPATHHGSFHFLSLKKRPGLWRPRR